jgi:hypothetical protein
MSARVCPACWHGELLVDDARDGGEVSCSNGCTIDAIVRAATAPKSESVEVFTRRASEVPVEVVRFLVPGRVPLGAVTLLAGDPGLGKSTLTALWAAQTTRGDFDGGPATVLIANAEDALGSVIVPRLAAAGANLEGVEFFTARDAHGERGFTIPDDVPALEALARESGARLVIIDPLNAHLGDGINAHRDHGIRRALAPLAGMAERLGAAVVVVSHLNKAQGTDALYRVGGSIGNVGAARSVLLFTRDPDDPDGGRRAVAHVKCNWARLAPTIIYEHQEATAAAGGAHVESHRLAYVGESETVAHDLLNPDRDDTPSSQRERADEVLADALGDSGWHRAKEVETIAARAGVSRRTLYRAASEAGVERERRGQPPVGFWRLPSRAKGVGTTGGTTEVAQLEVPRPTGDLGLSPSQLCQPQGNGTTGACGHCGGLLTTTPNGSVCFACAGE